VRDLAKVPQGRFQWARSWPGFVEAHVDAEWLRPENLSDRRRGEVVTDHRSSWVRRMLDGTSTFYVKTYDYPTRRDRLRGAFRTTFLASSRAVREWQALAWLRTHGFPGPKPCGALELRRHGWLRRAVLVTESYPGEPMDSLLPTLPGADRDRLLTALEEFVARLHAAGFRDRNLDLRNLLARTTERGWELTVIDSPRHRLVAAGPAHDRAACADWNRLQRSLVEVGLLPFRPVPSAGTTPR